MKNILICLQENVINSEFVQTVNTPHLKIWFWIAFLELIIIAFLILKFKKNKRDLAFGDISKQKIKNKKKSDIDMMNIMDSINGSKKLYKELSRSCHPDLFINSDKQNIAEEIFQNISNNERDYKQLSELKSRVRIKHKI